VCSGRHRDVLAVVTAGGKGAGGKGASHRWGQRRKCVAVVTAGREVLLQQLHNYEAVVTAWCVVFHENFRLFAALRSWRFTRVQQLLASKTSLIFSDASSSQVSVPPKECA
jgi:hypothetical protein